MAVAIVDEQRQLPDTDRGGSDTGLTAPELAEVAQITYRQVDYWTRDGLLLPDRPARGSGIPRLYGWDEAWVAWYIGVCARGGILPSAAVIAARSGGWLAPGVRITFTPEVLRTAPVAPGHQIPESPVQAVPV